MTMAAESALRVTVRAKLFGVGSKLPDNDGLVAGCRQNNIGVVDSGGEGGDPARVTLQIPTKRKCLGHVNRFGLPDR